MRAAFSAGAISVSSPTSSTGSTFFIGTLVQLGAVFVVKVRHQASGEENSKGTSKVDLATLPTNGMKRAYHNTGIGRAVKFAFRAGWEPFRLEIAASPRAAAGREAS